MSNPCLVFCPYLPISHDASPIEFADWELAPLRFFDDRWADPKFEEMAKLFLKKFETRAFEGAEENPALLCRKGKQLDGKRPSRNELRALELSLSFGFLESNPRDNPDGSAWHTVTTENLDLHPWPIDLEHGRVVLNKGRLVREWRHGYTIDNSRLIIAPPIDLHMPNLAPSPDPLVLTGVYDTVLCSLRSPGTDPEADAIRIAVDWFAKAWRNTETVDVPERIVFLKTAFEAVTRESNSYGSAKKLRRLFESLPNARAQDSETLLWSPEERPIYDLNRKDKNGNPYLSKITELQAWFLAFCDARNAIVHEGMITDLKYPVSNSSRPVTSRTIYHGNFFNTAERLLRGVIRVLLWKRGYEDVWRCQNIRHLRGCVGDALGG